MRKKPPSSLDYETLLHELALKGFRRAVLERDFPRALTYATRLSESADRFWRWQGQLDIASTHLFCGRADDALRALDEARAIYRDVPALSGPPDEHKAHVFLETGRPREAHEVASAKRAPTPLLLYLGGLGALRSGGSGVEEILAALSRSPSSSSAALARHLEALSRCDDSSPSLRGALSEMSPPDRISSFAGVLLLYALGSTLLREGQTEEALLRFEEIRGSEDAALLAPIPFVRSVAQTARIHAAQGNAEAARADWTSFLAFWGEGTLDPDVVAEGRQFVKA